MSTFREFMLEVGCVLDWHLVLCMHCPQVKGFSPGLINNDNNAVSNKSACYIISHWYICSSLEPYDSLWFNDGCLAMGEVTSRLLVGIEPQNAFNWVYQFVPNDSFFLWLDWLTFQVHREHIVIRGTVSYQKLALHLVHFHSHSSDTQLHRYTIMRLNYQTQKSIWKVNNHMQPSDRKIHQLITQAWKLG